MNNYELYYKIESLNMSEEIKREIIEEIEYLEHENEELWAQMPLTQ